MENRKNWILHMIEAAIATITYFSLLGILGEIMLGRVKFTREDSNE